MDVEVVPDASELIRAISGRCIRNSVAVWWARELGDLHASLIPIRTGRASATDPLVATADIEAQRARLINRIDVWAATHLPGPGEGATRYVATFGEIIDRVASAYAQAWWMILHAEDSGSSHEAWVHLAEVRDGYAELVEAIRARQIRFPQPWAGVPIVNRARPVCG